MLSLEKVKSFVRAFFNFKKKIMNDSHRLREVRLEKLRALQDAGIEPYPEHLARTVEAGESVGSFSDYEGTTQTIIGRVMALRDLGNIMFIVLRDQSGEIQVILNQDSLSANQIVAENLDVGDFLQVEGEIGLSKTEEISIHASTITMAAKSLLPLPDAHGGFSDDSERIRRRYLDFLMNQHARNTINVRSGVLRSIRNLMHERDFIEIETPMLESNPAGAQARTFDTHMNAMGIDMSLRIAGGELWHKMVQVGGFERVYEMGRVFRNEGIDYSHNPEFTMLEFYWAYSNFDEMIDFNEELIRRAAFESTGRYQFGFRGDQINLEQAFRRVDYNDLFVEQLEIDLHELESAQDLRASVLNRFELEIPSELSISNAVDFVFKKLIRPSIIQPTIVQNYPAFMSPLARRTTGNDEFIYMSQFVISGMEINRIYTELNNPIDRAERFSSSDQESHDGDNESWESDDNFVRAMEYGMPPMTGAGLGIDRLVMVLSESDSIRDVIGFPTVREE